MRNHIVNLLSLALVLAPISAMSFTEADYMKWFNENQGASPQFVDGDVITVDKADLIRPFVPAEFQDEWIFDGMEMTINSAAAAEMKPAQRYLDATAKHAGTASRIARAKDYADQDSPRGG